MEYRDRNQDPAYLYQRLGWTVRDRDPETADPKLGEAIEIEITDKKNKSATVTPGESNV